MGVGIKCFFGDDIGIDVGIEIGFIDGIEVRLVDFGLCLY